MWATGQFASYAVFGHRRPLNAVVVLGLVLSRTWRVTSRTGQLAYLIAFTAGVAVPAHRDARLRRAGDLDPAPHRRPVHDLSSLYLRGGTVFILIAVVSARCCSRTGPPRARWPARGSGAGRPAGRRSARASAACCRSAARSGRWAACSSAGRADRRPLDHERPGSRSPRPSRRRGGPSTGARSPTTASPLNGWSQTLLSAIHVDAGAARARRHARGAGPGPRRSRSR